MIDGVLFGVNENMVMIKRRQSLRLIVNSRVATV
jgi:hypothetical protein